MRNNIELMFCNARAPLHSYSTVDAFAMPEQGTIRFCTSQTKYRESADFVVLKSLFCFHNLPENGILGDKFIARCEDNYDPFNGHIDYFKHIPGSLGGTQIYSMEYTEFS